MNTTAQWCLYDFDVDISLGVWSEYKSALNFLKDNINSETDCWSLIPYEETLEYIVN